ncbi:hypothetical protein CYMTET_11433 [Cymbomonas tetramitiformis]|uniref:Reverse transcriptase domain-containing protein n=1 Tax=Cymbomonas tetramitiformis TaxID=36881 RepID=A0AAE0GMJ1_9CHLO|nr:hypothetical protein CYMTET_11433 [Cymbomonas tetramitiformis]
MQFGCGRARQRSGGAERRVHGGSIARGTQNTDVNERQGQSNSARAVRNPCRGDGSQGPRAAQVGVAVKGGADLGVHVVQAALDQHPEWVCVKADAKNAFNAVHREAVFEAIERDFPELWAWTDLWYGVEANLGFRLGNADGSVMRFIKLRENAQQGDPLGPPYLAAPLQAVLERVQERHLAVVVMAYLDDVHLIGPPVLAAAAPTKSAAYSPEGDVGCFADEMPGARGELDFINVLGVPVGKAEAVAAEMLKKEAAEEHDRRMREALQDLVPVTSSLAVNGDLRQHFLRGIPSCPALELSSAEYRVALRHILHVEQPLLGQVVECQDCGGEVDPTGTHFVGLPWGRWSWWGNWFSFIHHKLQRVLFEVAKSAYLPASALHDDFAGYLTYSPNHCPDVTVLDAEGPGRHVIFDVATTRPMADIHLGAAMMAPGAAAKNVEESKKATYGNMHPHEFVPFGVEVYGGLGPEAMAFLKKTQGRFGGRRYTVENAAEEEDVDEEGNEGGDEEEGRMAVGRWEEEEDLDLAYGGEVEAAEVEVVVVAEGVVLSPKPMGGGSKACVDG